MVNSVKLEGNFKIGNSEMVVVRTKGGASVMTKEEYKRYCNQWTKQGQERRNIQ